MQLHLLVAGINETHLHIWIIPLSALDLEPLLEFFSTLLRGGKPPDPSPAALWGNAGLLPLLLSSDPTMREGPAVAACTISEAKPAPPAFSLDGVLASWSVAAVGIAGAVECPCEVEVVGACDAGAVLV